MPKRKHKNGRPKITRNGVIVDKDKRWKIWNEPEREPKEVEQVNIERMQLNMLTFIKNFILQAFLATSTINQD